MIGLSFLSTTKRCLPALCLAVVVSIDNLIFWGVMSWECETNILAWYETVPSSANIADAPSRGDVTGLDPSLAIDVKVSDVLQSLLEVCPSDVKGGGAE